MPAFLLIDESITPKLAGQLKQRRRTAQSVAERFGRGLKDPELLRRIAEDCPEAVLVTTDDHLPEEHGELLTQLTVTIAVVDPIAADGYSEEEWKHEVLHRWAHRMVEQEPGTAKRYALRGSMTWRLRKKARLRPLVSPALMNDAPPPSGAVKADPALDPSQQDQLPLVD